MCRGPRGEIFIFQPRVESAGGSGFCGIRAACGWWVQLGDKRSVVLGRCALGGRIAGRPKHARSFWSLSALVRVAAPSVNHPMLYFKLTGKRVFLMAAHPHHFEKLGLAKSRKSHSAVIS